jgi:hypothetical protein
MKNEIVGNVPLPSDWANSLKASCNVQNKTTNTNQKLSTTSTSGSPERLALMKEVNPETLQKAAQVYRNNYK